MSTTTSAEETQGAEPFGWAVSGCHGLFKGEHAEQDAKAEAKRCGGTTKAFALFTRPAPSPADHIGDATKLVRERAALIDSHKFVAENGVNQAMRDLARNTADMLAADAQQSAQLTEAVDANARLLVRMEGLKRAQQVEVPQEGVSLLPGKSSDISIEGLVILDKDMREWAQGHGLHLFYLGSWHVMQGKKWLTVGYESPLKALEACWEGSSLDDAPAAAPPPPNGACDSLELCKLNGECAGQYGTKQKCTDSPTPPRAERVPMTPEQISDTYQKATGQHLRPCDKHAVETLTREIEAHHKIGVKP